MSLTQILLFPVKVASQVGNFFLKQEDGFFLLQEDGFRILLD